MNVTCVICSDLFTPTAEIYVTGCGHIFHYVCLIQWLERSKTCPQCRNKTTEKSIHRLYFNLPNTSGIADDVGTLQCKVDNLQFQLTLKDKDINTFKDKYKTIKHQNATLREEIRELESRARVTDSSLHAFKEQISYLKSKSKDNDRLHEEIDRLKTKLRHMENVELVLNGSVGEVEDMLRVNQSTEQLCMLVSTLKRSLRDSDRKNKELESKIKRSHNELANYRMDLTAATQKNTQLLQEIECHKKCESERTYLKSKIKEVEELLKRNKHAPEQTKSIERIGATPMLRMSNFTNILDEAILEKVYSPTVHERVQQIKESDSPYLNLKPTTITLGAAKMSTSTNNANKFSIFKQSSRPTEPTKKASSQTDIAYDGLGGHSKSHFDAFPSPILKPVKRQKPASTITAVKFRKLTPNQKLDDFVSRSSDDV